MKSLFKIAKGANILASQIRSGKINTVAIKRSLFGNRISEICPPPIFIQIEPTTACNLRCKSCTRDTYPRERLSGMMSLEIFKRIIDKIPSLCFIKLQDMGEPLLNREIFDMGKYAKSKGISASITTNGTLISKDNAEKLLIFDSIVISFDGATKKTFEELRVGARFEKVVENVKLLVNARNNLGSNAKIILHFVASGKNYNEIDALASLAKKIGVDEVSISPVQIWTDENNPETYERITSLKPPVYDLKIECERAVELCKGSKTKISYTLFYPNNEKSCAYPFETCFVTYEGFITSCCTRMNPLVYNFGNILEEDFEGIWNGRKYRDFRKHFIDKKTFSVCKNCPN